MANLKTKLIKIFVFLQVLVLNARDAGAQITIPNVPPPPQGQAVYLSEVENIISRIAQFLINISVLLAIVFLAWGGIMYMSAGGDQKKVDDARARIKNGILGALVVFGIGVILQTTASIVDRTFFCRYSIFGVCVWN